MVFRSRPSPQTLRKIAFINFGGIGDEILFAPVIEAVKAHVPQVQMTLILEDRSRVVSELLPDVDHVVTVALQRQSRWKSFFQIWKALRQGSFDAVISSGSNAMIPVLLFLSGIPVRVGFQTGWVSRRLLTVEAPLAPKHDRKGYAAVMYFALAKSFLRWLLPVHSATAIAAEYTGKDDVGLNEVIEGDADSLSLERPHIVPRLKSAGLEELMWAKGLLKPDDPRRKILIHPGVSEISVQKNILKAWSPHAWAELIRLLTLSGSVSGNQVFLLGGPDDREAVESILQEIPSDTPNFVNLYGKTRNLVQLAALIQACDLLVGVDSSPMHMAVGYGKPVVALFGPTDEKKLLPLGDPRFKAVTVPDLACRPCLWDVRNDSCDTPVCLEVPVPLMLAAVESLLATTAQ